MLSGGAPVRAAALGLGLMSLVLAGCLGGADAVDPDLEDDQPAVVPAQDVARITENLIPDGPDHDHTDPKQHAGVAENIHQLDLDDRGDLTNQFGEMDVVGNRLYQCVLGDGFRVFDIGNRSDPVQVGHYPGTSCADIKVTGDNMFAVVSGDQLFDVRDPADMRLVYEYERGCHMCFIHEIDGREYVFMAQSLRGSAPDDLPNQGYIEIVELVRSATSGEATMEHVGVYKMDKTDLVNTHLWDVPLYEFSIHDMYVYDDPVEEKPIMVVAHWDMGVRFVDVTEPAAPTEFAKWDDFKGDCGDIHTVEVDFIDDRRIVAAATENGIIIDPLCSVNRLSWGFVYLMDATDFGDIKTLGKWHVPGVQPSEPFPRQDEVPPSLVGLFSAHNIHFINGYVYEAMYHGGIWVIDAAAFVRDGGASELDTLLRADTVPTVGAFFPTCNDAGPNVWDLWVVDGYLYGSDMDCGLVTAHFVGNPLNDPLWTGDA